MLADFQALAVTIHDSRAESSEASETPLSEIDFTSHREPRSESYPLESNPDHALAAGESNLPDQIDVSHLLPGFRGFACGSVRRPSEATVLTFFCPVQRGSHSPSDVVVSWPGGASRPCSFREYSGDWTAKIEIELHWKKAVALLDEGKVVVALTQ